MDTHRCDNNRPALSLPLLLLASTAALCADRSDDPASSTFFGGSAGEMVRDVEVDGSGNIDVAGTTSSGSWPTRNAFQSQPNGAGDALLANPGGDRNGR